jgi:ribosomal protein L37AE/L43A
MLLATWDNYHCLQLINEKMKCINCHQYFYINMKNGLLTCLNKKCGFISKPNRILWTCCTCKKDFKSGAIPYNPLDIQVTKKLILQTILLRHKAHPKKMICGCKLNVFFTEFNHSKNCDGILYESELDDNTIIVCEKCKMITYIDRFIWTCPKCKKKFKNGIGENNNCIINDDIRDNYNSEEIVVDISDKNKYRKDKDKELNDIDSNKKNNSTPFPKHLNYASKRLKNYKLKQEKKEEEINNNNNIENEKKEEKKVISSGWKHRRYSSSHPCINTDTNKAKEENNPPKEDNIIKNEEITSNNKEEKKSFKKFRHREKGKDVLK